MTEPPCDEQQVVQSLTIGFLLYNSGKQQEHVGLKEISPSALDAGGVAHEAAAEVLQWRHPPMVNGKRHEWFVGPAVERGNSTSHAW